MEIKVTGISIERFEKILKKSGYKIVKRDLFLINPNYEVKFGLKPRKHPAIVSYLWFLDNLITTSAYYLIQYP